MGDVKGAVRQAIARPAPAPCLPQEYPVAYAIIEGPPGRWTAVCLEGVTARALQRLEPNGEPEPQARAALRIARSIEQRTVAKKWGAP